MYCANCGTKLDDGAKFCHNCGTPTAAFQTPVTGSAPQPAAAPAVQEVPVQAAAAPVQPQQPQSQPVSAPQPAVQEVQAQPVPASSYSYSAPAAQPQPFPASQPGVQNAQAQSAPALSYTTPASAAQPLQSQPAAGQFPVYAQTPVPQKSKSKGRVAVAVILLIALLVGGWFIFFRKGGGDNPSPSGGGASTSGYASGMDAFNAEDYEAAATLLEEELRESPNDLEKANALIVSYLRLSYDELTDDDYEASESYILKAYALNVESELLNTYSHDFYTLWFNGMSDGTLPVDTSALDRGAERLSDDEQLKYRPLYIEVTDMSSLARAAVAAIDGDNYMLACRSFSVYEGILSEEIDANGPFLYATPDGSKFPLILFRAKPDGDGYYAYYGDVDGSGMRNGEGFIFTHMTYDGSPTAYFYYSQWKNDIPNGTFYEAVLNGDNYSERTLYQGSLVNGLYDGELSTLMGGVTYIGSYSNGYPVKIRTTSDGLPVVAEADDGSDRYLTMTDETILQQYGIELY